YLKLLEGSSYTSRDHKKIFAYFEGLGYGSQGTSQDGAKDVAANVIGSANLMSYVCYGKYVGDTGVHQTADLYEKAGYADTALFPDAVDEFDFPSRDLLDSMIGKQRSMSRSLMVPAIKPGAAAAAPATSRFETPHLFEGELAVLTRAL